MVKYSCKEKNDIKKRIEQSQIKASVKVNDELLSLYWDYGRDIVDAYNKQEAVKAKKEHRKPEMMPRISAHILRHTGCTRMAERGMDVKVLQYIMGHANIAAQDLMVV